MNRIRIGSGRAGLTASPGGFHVRSFALIALLAVVVPGCTRVGNASPDRAPAPVTGPVDRPIERLEYQPSAAILLLDSLEFPKELADPILDSGWRRLPSVAAEWERWMDYARGPGRESVLRILERQGRYATFVDEEIENRGLPHSLRWLPVIESSYLPSAESRVGAVGLWQLMGPTAMDLGLQIDPHVDERLDPVVSTGAGLEYLGALHGRFDSWLLALAAYNGGQGRVSRLLDQHAPGRPPSDELFEVISPYLPQETRQFVPKFIAYAMIARTPEPFGMGVPTLDNPIGFDVVEVPDATSLDVIAVAAGAGLDEVQSLNPQILRGYTPFGRATEVRVPEGTGELFNRAFPLIPPEERVSFVEHRIRSGETLTHLASQYGIPVSEIRAANPGVRPERLQIGQWITVPRARLAGEDPGLRSVLAAVGDAGDPDLGDGEPRTHTVRRGESLWIIARRYGVAVDTLARENGLRAGATIHPGLTLLIPDDGVQLET